MIDKIEDRLTSGIPCYEPLEMNTNSFLKCANDTVKTNERLGMLKEEADKRVETVIGMPKSRKYSNLFTKMSTYSLVTDSRAFIGIDRIQIMINILRDMAFLERDMSKEELNKLYSEGNNDFVDQLNFAYKHAYTSEYISYIRNKFVNIYSDRNGERIETFFPRVLNFFDTVTINNESIKSIETRDLVDDYLSYMNIEKTVLKIAFDYLEKANLEAVKGNFIKAQEYLFFVTNYLKENKRRKLFVSVNFSYDTLLNNYKKILNDYPILKELDMDRILFLDRTYDQNYPVIDSLINMEKLHVDSILLKHDEPYHTTGENKSTRTRHEVTDAEREEIRKVLQHRHFEYLSNGPIAQINGSASFSDYIAFLYNNGVIIADRLLNVNTIGQTQSDAIYLFDALHFEEDVKHTKQEVKRIVASRGGKGSRNHVEGWEKLNKIDSTKDMPDDIKDAAQDLVKRLKK